MQLPGWGYKAFVLKSEYVAPTPVITKFVPGHDYRQFTAAASGDTVRIEIHFSAPMDCKNIQDSLLINSTTADRQVARLDDSSIDCKDVPDGRSPPPLYSGGVNTTWIFAADLVNLSNGIHTVTVRNASTADRTSSTKVLPLLVPSQAGSKGTRAFTTPRLLVLTCCFITKECDRLQDYVTAANCALVCRSLYASHWPG